MGQTETPPENHSEPPAGLQIEYREASTLIPYARNSRTHTDEQVAQIAASITEFGFTNPVLIRENEAGIYTIVAGHARCRAAALLGMQTVPTINLGHLSDTQARAYIIADNRLSELAGWDIRMLDAEFRELTEAGMDTDLTGFDEKARMRVQNEVEREDEANRRKDEDKTGELPRETNIKAGDIITMGDHILICGDATDPEIHTALLGKERPGLMVTDPPYGVNLDANWRAAHGNQPKRDIIKNDDRADWGAVYQLFTGNVAYVWHSAIHSTTVAEGLIQAGFQIRSQIIWLKNRFAMSRGHYHWQHEPCWYSVKQENNGKKEIISEFYDDEHDPCWYVVKKGKTGSWTGSRKETTVWNIDIVQALEFGHPNQKPVECMRRPIINNSNPGQLVFDPFAGTGTTLIAAQLTGRKARCIELDPHFCQLIVNRYNSMFDPQSVGIQNGPSEENNKA